MSVHKLVVLFSESKKLELESLNRVLNKDTSPIQAKSDVNFLWYYNERFGLFHIVIDKDFVKAKQHFFLCGQIDEYLIINHDSRVLDYGINHLSYALLSDCNELIYRYAFLQHTHYREMIENGMSTPMYALQCIIKEDWPQLQWAIEIIKNKTLKKNKALEPDLNFYEGMLLRNKVQIEDSLKQLIKDHKKRNKAHPLIGEFISHPALGYAKLAWMKGIEAVVDSSLVPKELLPVRPNENYEDTYGFLRGKGN
jgi:hypothetical protein